MTPWVWFLGIGFATYHGESLGRAMAISAVQVAGGLAAWACYHFIGRQNNGMLIFAFTLSAGQASYRPDHALSDEILLRACGGVVNVAIFIVVGLICRVLGSRRAGRKAKTSGAKSPLWDNEVDMPPANQA